MLKRKDIENLQTILLAIKRVESVGDASSIQIAENLDALYSALKSQANTVIENQLLEEIDHVKSH